MKKRENTMESCRLLIHLVLASVLGASAFAADTTRYVFELEIPGPSDDEDSAGGIIVADVTSDGKPDYLVTCTGHLAVHDNRGNKLWVKKTDIVLGWQSESQGLPGHHGPGVGAGDVDGDGRTEVLVGHWATTIMLFDLPPGILYFDGNSLGPPAVDAADKLAELVGMQWGGELVGAWNSCDWIDLAPKVAALIAPLVGARPDEVAVADSTSINLVKVLAERVLADCVSQARRGGAS